MDQSEETLTLHTQPLEIDGLQSLLSPVPWPQLQIWAILKTKEHASAESPWRAELLQLEQTAPCMLFSSTSPAVHPGLWWCLI